MVKIEQEIIKADLLDLVIDQAKMMNSEIIVIPRMLFQSSIDTSIVGLTYNARVDIGNFKKLEEYSTTPIWIEPSLSNIALYRKDIANFVQSLKGTKENELDKLEYPTLFNLVYEVYDINGVRICIGLRLEHPSSPDRYIPLVNHIDIMRRINNLVYYTYLGRVVLNNIDITEEEDFTRIRSLKVTSGIQIWRPKIDNIQNILDRYTMYLSANLIKNNKGDVVLFSIIDNFPCREYNRFITKFTIIKPKKKCTISSFMMLVNIL